MNVSTERIDRRVCLEFEEKHKPLMIDKAVKILNEMIDSRAKDIERCLYTVGAEEIKAEIINKLKG